MLLVSRIGADANPNGPAFRATGREAERHVERLMRSSHGDDRKRRVARLEHYELAVPVWMAAKFKFPKANLLFRKGAQIMQRHDGAPTPEPELAVPDPDLLDWDVNLIRGKKADFKGTVAARDHKTAIDVAIERFKLAQWQIARLVVTVQTRPVYGR
jgi:hypothetical protein